MTFEFRTACKYHTRDGDYSCGAACVMMLLAKRGVCYPALKQNALMNKALQAHPWPHWSMSPDGLAYLLNLSFPGEYQVFNTNTAAMSNSDLVQSLIENGQPVVALTNHGRHWVVVTGFWASLSPELPGSVPYGVWIDDPVYYFQKNGHSDNDTCGTGTVPGSGGSQISVGVSDRYVPWGSWLANYFTKVEGTAPPAYFVVGRTFTPASNPFTFHTEPSRKSGISLVSKKQAQQDALQALQRIGFEKEERIGAAIRNRALGAPMLVQSPDNAANTYYLIPLGIPHATVGLVLIDAHSGDLEEIQIFQKPQKEWIIEEQEAKNLAARINLSNKGVKRLQSNMIPLIFKPCLQSFSRFQPFYEVNYGSHKVYVRSDGAVFTDLTVPPYGS